MEKLPRGSEVDKRATGKTLQQIAEPWRCRVCFETLVVPELLCQECTRLAGLLNAFWLGGRGPTVHVTRENGHAICGQFAQPDNAGYNRMHSQFCRRCESVIWSLARSITWRAA